VVLVAARDRLTGLWHNPNFVRLWAAQTVSSFGSLVTTTAVPFVAILVLGASPFQLALIGIAEIVPAFLVGLVVGVWIDRLQRRPIMIAADVGRAVVLGTIPLAALLGTLQIGQLYVTTALSSILTIIFDVASHAYVPTLVERDALVEGNSKLAASEAVVEFSASGVGGWLVQWFSAPYAIAVDAASFLWSAWLLGRIKAPELPPPPAITRRPVVHEIREGLRFLVDNPLLRRLATAAMIFQCAGRIYVTVFLLYATRDLGFQPGVLGLIFALGGATSFAGALVAQRVIRRVGLRWALIASFVLIGAGNGLAALAGGGRGVAGGFLVAQQFVKDPAYPVLDVAGASLRQIITPNRWQGRVHASLRVIEFGGMLLGAILGGWLGETIGLQATIAAGALGCAAAALPLLLARSDDLA
jgi:MFS family permease